MGRPKRVRASFIKLGDIGRLSSGGAGGDNQGNESGGGGSDD